MNPKQLSKTVFPALLLALPACILVVDGDGDWDGVRWHDGHSHDAIRGSGVSKTEQRTISDFKSVVVNGSTDVELAVGPASSLELTADDNLLEYLVTEVRDGVLVIEMKSGSYSPRVDAKVRATTPGLETVAIRGSADVAVGGVSGEKFTFEISGSGDGRVEGKVGSTVARVTGSGDLRLSDLEARDAVVEVTGSGDVDVWATESLSISISGSGDVSYKGDPAKVTKAVAGSGDVRKR